jgi:hypothetical protein
MLFLLVSICIVSSLGDIINGPIQSTSIGLPNRFNWTNPQNTGSTTLFASADIPISPSIPSQTNILITNGVIFSSSVNSQDIITGMMLSFDKQNNISGKKIF